MPGELRWGSLPGEPGLLLAQPEAQSFLSCLAPLSAPPRHALSLFRQSVLPPSEFLLPSSLASTWPRLLLAAQPGRSYFVVQCRHSGWQVSLPAGYVMATHWLRVSVPGLVLASDLLSGFFCLDASLACAPEQRARKLGPMALDKGGVVNYANRNKTGSVHPSTMLRGGACPKHLFRSDAWYIPRVEAKAEPAGA